MAKKMPGRLVALSASAVATIYVAGLLSTQPAADSVSAASAGLDPAVVTTPTSSLAGTAANPVAKPSVVVGASAATLTLSSATPTLSSIAAATATTAATAATGTSSAANSSTYANGTYVGTGTSRFGNVSVSVTTTDGKLTNVQITRVTTSYPVSRIASLPAQVIQNQTANVNVVTGATYSSQAFRQAVQQALSQAAATTTIATVS